MRAGPVPAGIAVGLAIGVGVFLSASLRPGARGRDGSPALPAAASSPPAFSPRAGPGDSQGGGPPPVSASHVERLRALSLSLPLAGLDVRQLRDSFGDSRAGGTHEALDIPAPRGTPVLAVGDGTVARLFTSARGGLTVYQFDSASTYCYYYAHLDGFAPGLREGAALRRGDLIGFVGTTGNAPPQTPHLHFAIYRLGSPPRWWEGTPVNPFAVWAPPD